MSGAEMVAAVLMIIGTGLVVTTSITLWRAPDALTRVNLLGQTVGVALPLFLIAKLTVDFARDGFDLLVLIQALVTLFGVWIIGAVATYYLGRAIYGVTVTDVKHSQRQKSRSLPDTL